MHRGKEAAADCNALTLEKGRKEKIRVPCKRKVISKTIIRCIAIKPPVC
jgi:hypothetical protein